MNNHNSKIDDNNVNNTDDTYLEYNEGYVDSSKIDRIKHTSKHHSEKNYESKNDDSTR